MEIRWLPEDINARSLGGIVVINNVPHLVETWNKDTGYFLRNLHDERRSYSTKKLEMEEVALGNVQMGKSYGYVARIPHRKWKQTITFDNSKVLAMPFGCSGVRELKDLYQSTYPKIDVALRKVVDKELLACCFHKEFGFFSRDGNIYLAYRNKEVGVVKNDAVSLYEKKFYLKEMLNEIFSG